jgi:hypothetical protein
MKSKFSKRLDEAMEKQRAKQKDKEVNCRGCMNLGSGCGTCPSCLEQIAEAAKPQDEYLPPIAGEDALHSFAELIYDTTKDSIEMGTSPRRQVMRIRQLMIALLKLENDEG